MCFLYTALAQTVVSSNILNLYQYVHCMLLSSENAIDTGSGWGGGGELGLIYCACAKEKRMRFNLHYTCNNN